MTMFMSISHLTVVLVVYNKTHKLFIMTCFPLVVKAGKT